MPLNAPTMPGVVGCHAGLPWKAVVFRRDGRGAIAPCFATVKRRISGRLAAAMIAVELYAAVRARAMLDCPEQSNTSPYLGM